MGLIVMSSTRFFSSLILFMAVVIAHGGPTRTHHARQQGTICGHGSNAGIQKPANGSTFAISQSDQDSGWTTLEVIFCSDAYFKTSSINVTTWITYTDNPRYGVLLASGIEPDPTVADPGFYGYRFNVSFGPSDEGDWDLSDARTLFVQESQTGW